MPMALKAEFRCVALVADSMLEQFYARFVHRLFLLLPGLHWHPRAMPLFPTLCSSWRSLFVVLEPIKLLLFRFVAVGPMLVAKLVLVGVKRHHLPLSSPWGLLCWRRGGVVHDIQHPIPGTLASPCERLLAF